MPKTDDACVSNLPTSREEAPSKVSCTEKKYKNCPVAWHWHVGIEGGGGGGKPLPLWMIYLSISIGTFPTSFEKKILRQKFFNYTDSSIFFFSRTQNTQLLSGRHVWRLKECYKEDEEGDVCVWPSLLYNWRYVCPVPLWRSLRGQPLVNDETPWTKSQDNMACRCLTERFKSVHKSESVNGSYCYQKQINIL